MRFLLVGISIIFSFIFFLFYTASLGKNIFFQPSDNFFFSKSLFGDMWITPVIYLIITAGLFIYFKSKILLKEDIVNNRPVLNINFLHYIFFTTLFYIFIFILFFIFNIKFSWIIFIFAGSIGLYFIGKYLFYHKKISKNLYISLNIFSILSGYGASLVGILYTAFVHENIIFVIILNFIGFFHIYTHVKYENIISLLFGIITFIFALYRLITYFLPGII